MKLTFGIIVIAYQALQTWALPCTGVTTDCSCGTGSVTACSIGNYCANPAANPGVCIPPCDVSKT
jgi:hypothetical protein